MRHPRCITTSKVLIFHFLSLSRQVPVNLLRASRVFVFEPPPGVKANLLRTFSAVSAVRMCKVRKNFSIETVRGQISVVVSKMELFR